jgi:hypothetical protein
VLSALRAKKAGAKKIQMTGGVDPTAPKTFREHGGSLIFRGKGPKRHANDLAIVHHRAVATADPKSGNGNGSNGSGGGDHA